MSDTDKDNFFSVKDLYEQYWRCRDFELTNLWQRSVFLTAFTVIFLTAFGAFFIKAFSPSSLNNFLNTDLGNAHLISVLLSLVGLFFSILWIAMAKASKSWYEVYEKAIGALDQYKFSEHQNFLCIPKVAEFHVERLDFYDSKNSPRFDSSLFSTHGGLFSPSKINIAIGQVLFIIWSFTLFFHIACSILILTNTMYCCALDFRPIVLSLLLTITILLVLAIIFRRRLLMLWIGSSTLAKKDPRDN